MLSFFIWIMDGNVDVGFQPKKGKWMRNHLRSTFCQRRLLTLLIQFFIHKRRYFFHIFGWTYMLPLTSIVYSYASIAWVIWKSSHRVQRGVHMRNERIVMLDVVDEIMSFIQYRLYYIAHMIWLKKIVLRQSHIWCHIWYRLGFGWSHLFY